MLGNAIGFLERPKIGGLSSLPDEPGNPGQLDPLSESDWNGVVASSHKHGVAPLLYHRLTSSSSAPQLPENTAQALREAYLMNGARNTLLFQDLAKLLEALPQDGIPVIVLKGACLAELTYGNAALRQMHDIDLVVGKADLRKTTNRLRAIGYACEDHDLEKWCLLCYHLPPFIKQLSPRVEIHWTILPQPSHFDPIWNAFGVARVRRSLPVPTHWFCLLRIFSSIFALMPGGQNNGSFSLGLRPLCDITAVVEHNAGEIDWREVESRAKEWQAARCVFLALLLSKTMLAACVPEDFLESLRPRDFDAGLLAAARDIVLTDELDSGMRLVKTLANHCAGAPFGNRMKSLVRTAFPSLDYMAHYMAEHYSLPLSPIRSYTSYWTRGMDLLGKGVRLAWHGITCPRAISMHVRSPRQSALFQKWLGKSNH